VPAVTLPGRRASVRAVHGKHASGPSRRNVPTGPGRCRRLRRSTSPLVSSAGGCTVEATVARYYDPTTAQFLTRDPLEAETGQPYSYADDDPIDNSDPRGMFSWHDLDPLHYYNDEIQAYESGCGYWDSVKYGLFGAGEATAEVATAGYAAGYLGALGATTEGAAATAAGADDAAATASETAEASEVADELDLSPKTLSELGTRSAGDIQQIAGTIASDVPPGLVGQAVTTVEHLTGAGLAVGAVIAVIVKRFSG
jgi:hypothetical protein